MSGFGGRMLGFGSWVGCWGFGCSCREQDPISSTRDSTSSKPRSFNDLMPNQMMFASLRVELRNPKRLHQADAETVAEMRAADMERRKMTYDEQAAFKVIVATPLQGVATSLI